MKDLARHLVRAGATNKRRQDTPPQPTPPAAVAEPLDSWEVEPPVETRGRPKQDKPRGLKINVLLTIDEKRDLDRYIRKYRMRSISECVRSLLIAGMKGPPPPAVY